MTRTTGQIVDMLSKVAQLQRLPLAKPDVFQGDEKDKTKFFLWETAFDALIDSAPVSESQKLYLLYQHLGGKARQVVEMLQFSLRNPDTAYQEARLRLKERFGHCQIVCTEFEDRLDKWPKIGPNDAQGLREYSDFLQQALLAQNINHSMKIYEFPSKLQALVEKMPSWFKTNWSNQVQILQQREGRGAFPSFSDFVNQVKFHAERMNIPQIAWNTKPDNNRTSSERSKTPQPAYKKPRSGATVTALAAQSNNSSNRQEDHGKENTAKSTKAPDTREQFCPYHKTKTHSLINCKKFLDLDYDTRKGFVFKNRICFNCGTSDTHTARSCKAEEPKCDKCGERHLTMLHHQEKEDKSSVKCTQVCEENKNPRSCARIVLAKIFHHSNPEKEVLTYGVLDDQSTDVFITEDLLSKLEVEGSEINLQVNTITGTDTVRTSKVHGLRIQDVGRNFAPMKIPHAYTRETIPATHYEIVTPDIARQWKHLEGIADEIHYRPDVEIGLLIGRNVPSAFQPLRVVYGQDEEPWGEEYKFGWTVIGPVCLEENGAERVEVAAVNRITARKETSYLEVNPTLNNQDGTRSAPKDVTSSQQIRSMMELDYSELYHNRRAHSSERTESVEDKRFCKILDTETVRNDEGHWETPLPLRSRSINLPDNKEQCTRRLLSLKRKLVKNEKIRSDYLDFMQKILDRKHAERVPADEIPGKPGNVWYIPHFDVYHPKKPDQIRVVYDCSAVFSDTSLNSQLLSGPDLTNSLLGVLLRFREEEVAITCDVEQMFHSFHVKPEHRDLLRFLWFEGNNLNGNIVEYRMRVHLFGAISSPAVANFCLLKTAEEGRSKYGDEAADFLCRNFYVDDGLKSVPTSQEAVELIKNSQAMCSESKLRLHKFASNDKAVLTSVPNHDRAKSLKDLDLRHEALPIQRSLGTFWCIESDCFKFRIELRDKPPSRRGILSTISSIYDPLGLISPVILKGKQVLQELCRLNADWDEPIPDAILSQWEKWRTELFMLENVEVPRCVKPADFGDPVVVEIHSFSDACETGIGQVSYLRMVNENGKAHVSFLLAKSRVAPIKPMSIPRLELTAAVVSVNVATMLLKELSYKDPKLFFHTDSEVVIGYIHNETRRFHVYVGNRVQHIRDRSVPDQWYHVPGKENPADEASRSLSASEFLQDKRWFHGPEFLWNPYLSLARTEATELSEDDVEVRQAQATVRVTECLQSRNSDSNEKTKERTCSPKDQLNLKYFERFSSWENAKRWVAQLKTGVQKLKQAKFGIPKENAEQASSPVSSVQELRNSEMVIIRSLQRAHFKEEMAILSRIEGNDERFEDRQKSRNRNKVLKKTSSLFRLDPFIDQDGLLRVGGRLSRASEPFDVKHPLIIPKGSHLTELIIRHFHNSCQHQGRGITHNAIRQAGLWIINGRSAVSQLISKCVKCRKFRGGSLSQKMSDLPEERVTASEPFLYTGIDVFGPWLIKEGRKSLKRYGLIFTCLAARAVHLETLNTMETDSFINALRRFMCRRGRVRVLRSDCGTNFVGANNELREALSELDNDKIKRFLLKQDCDWVEFKFNVPKASHMGGVWERMIRTVRSVLSSLLDQHGSQLDDESLRTIMVEAENIVNCRPLTVDNLSDPTSPEPITPQQLLTSKTSVVSAPPGDFQPVDLYCRKRWRRVQYLTGLFWSRWQKEYCMFQHNSRQKWNAVRRDSRVGDVVMIHDEDQPRNQWPLGRVVKTYPSKDGRVRKVQLLVTKGDRRRLLDRPVHKLVLLLEKE